MSARLTLALAGSLALAACASAPETTPMTETAPATSEANPFFVKSDLPYEAPPFDRIRNEHFLPAFEKGMAQELAQIEAIANSETKATFDNTIVAMERSGEILGRVAPVFYNLSGAHTNPELQAVRAEIAPKLSAHRDAIYLNGALFDRINSLYAARDSLGLDPESLRLLERYHTDFIRAGAKLSEEQKATLRKINSEIATLTAKFSENVLAEVNDAAVVFDSADDLAGLSDAEISAAAKAAAERGMEGKYLIALKNTTGQPPLASLTNRASREKIHRASVTRGIRGNEYDNRNIVRRVAELRAERARLLGYPNHAAFVLEDETAQTTRAVNQMLGRLAPAAIANAKREAADIQAIIDAEGGQFRLAPWDWAYYTEKVRKAKYDFDDSQLRPYFEMESVLQNGIFYMAEKLYGITFKERNDLPVYHPDVRVFEVFEEDGERLGLFYVDMYARPSKRGGAWMNQYVSQSTLLGQKPVVGNHLNVPKPPEGEPTLMTYDEVETAFHEFGHAVHGLFSNVKYPRFSGTSVPRDFVEYPSQVHEMWAVWPEVLSNYARHYETGELIPQELLDKVLRAQTFNEGFKTSEYLAAAIIDQYWHQLTPEEIPDDAIAFEKAALVKSGMDFPPVPPRYRTAYFSHIMGGYSAGYYAYIWSEVLDAESVLWFKENGGLDRENGDHFRRTLLSRGGSVDAMKLFRDFAGREPRVEPLLERRGLTSPSAY